MQLFMPDGFKVWKDTFSSRFQVRHQIFGTLSRSWQLHGSYGSGQQVLAWAWEHAALLGCEEDPPAWIRNVEWRV
eukprot:9793600-Prorocentrum_lima.AAC.1